jgi:hypothetical protein
MTLNHTHLKSNKSKVCLVFDDQRLTCVCVQLQYLKLSLIQHLTPYVYFRFQLGFLYYKSFNLIPYVYFRFQFGFFRQFCHMWQTVCIRGRHVDTWVLGHVSN